MVNFTISGYQDSAPASQTLNTQNGLDANGNPLGGYDANGNPLGWGGKAPTGMNNPGVSMYGDPNSQGGEKAARNNASIYYGTSASLGADAQDYRNRVKGQLDKPSALAARLTNTANQDISRANAKAGLKGVDTTAASIRERRNAVSKSNEMQQNQDTINLANYGKSIGAGISGTESLAAAGAGRGVASTPTPTPSYGGFLGSIICAELYSQGKLNLKDLAGSKAFKETISKETYEGYLVIAKPIVKLMKRSDKFSNLFIGWAKSISVGKPNLLTRIMIPICFCIGKINTFGVKDGISARA